jgi:hypothetical protein
VSTAEIVIALLAAGGATIIAAFVNAFFNRRKLGAEATQIITQAAAGTVENIMKDNTILRDKIISLETRMIKLQAIVELSEQRERIHAITEERYRWHMQQWHAYCSRQTEELRRLGGEIEDPPPAWPEPVRYELRSKNGRAIAADPNVEEL